MNPVRGRAAFVAGLCLLGPMAEASEALEAMIVSRDRLEETESAVATLTPTPLVELPLSVSHLPITALEERMPRDIADMADYVPGVSRRSNYWGINTPSFQLRGFNAGESSAYYRDGFRYQSRGPTSMANVEGIEILRGPVGALYGWAEPGGGVHVRTKQPLATPLAELTVYGDHWGHGALQGDFGGSWGENGRYRLVAAHEAGGSFRDRQSLGQTLLAPSLAVDFSGGRNLFLALEWLDDRRTTDYGIPALDGRPAAVPASRVYTEDWGRQHSRSARWTQPWAGGDLSLAGSFYDFRYLEYHDVESASVSGTRLRRWYETYPEFYRWRTAYLDWTREFATGEARQRFLARLEWADEQRGMYAPGEFGAYVPMDIHAPVYGQAWTRDADFSVFNQAWRNRSLGLSVQDEIRIGRWTGLVGGRYTRLWQRFDYSEALPKTYAEHAVQTDNAFMPRLGLSWRAGGWSLSCFRRNAQSAAVAHLE